MRAPLRFLLVGLACAALNNVLVIALDAAGVHYALAAAIAFVPVLLAGYALHVAFTFSQTPGWVSLARYGLAMLANYPLLVALLFVLCDLGQLPVRLAVPIATVLMFVWNYAASRWAIVARAPSATATAGSRSLAS